MLEFWIALIIFIGSHSITSRPKLRQKLTGVLGEKTYLILYSLLSLLLLSWLIMAAIDAPRTPLWPWVHGFYWVPNILMPFAFIFLVSGFTVPNPLSIAPRDSEFDPDRPSFTVAVTRHPVMFGFFLWAVSHIVPNGEFPLAFMFGLFALLAWGGTYIIDKKRRRIYGDDQWQQLSRNTSSIPFANTALWTGHFKIRRSDISGIFIGLILYAIFFHAHQSFFGITPLPPLP
jgi:uncharacterized membrane protein